MKTLIHIAALAVLTALLTTDGNAQMFISAGTPVKIASNCPVTVLDMDFENSGDLEHAGDLEVRGSVINQSAMSADAAVASRIALTGNWTNNGSFTPGIGISLFNGTDQDILGSSTSSFYDLTMQGVSGNTKSLYADAEVLNTLNLTASKFDLRDQTLRLADASIPVSRSTGFIATNFAGRLRADVPANISGSREMPMGYGSSDYRPVFMINPAAGSFDFTLVGQSPDNYAMPVDQLNDSLCEVLDEFFYRIETGSSPLNYGIARLGSESDYTALARWNADWFKISGSGPQSGIPGNNLGFNSQTAGQSQFIAFGKERPFVEAGPDLLLTKIGESATVQASGYIPSSAWTLWTPADDLSCTGCLQPDFTAGLGGVYTIVIDNGPGCIASDSLQILVVRDDIVLPNAFTPNGDNLNDVFQPFLFPNETLVNIKIYNRWGEKVHDSPTSWDGYFEGERALPGVYTYFMEIRQRGLGFEKRIHKNGTLTLIL